MFRSFRTARRKTSYLAMALALTGSAAIGTAIVAPAAAAQEQEQNFSRGFVETYQPVAALTQGEATNLEGARAQLETVYAAIETPDDRHAAGNLALIIGTGLNDDALRRRGLETMLESGKVAPAQVGQFHFYVANFAYNMADYAGARAALTAAMNNGYVDSDDQAQNDPEYIYMQSYSAEGNPAAGVSYIIQQAQARTAAGRPVPVRWLLRALQDSYDGELSAQAVDVAVLLLQNDNTRQNWLSSMQVVNALNELEPAARVDLMRLMYETDTLTQRVEFVRFIEDLDPRIMGNEVLGVLQAGLDAGEFDTSDPYYIEVRGIAGPRAENDRRDRATYIREGENGDARDALATGDVLYSLQDYAEAVRFYQLALERGLDSDTANTRLGIAQTKVGNYAAAKEAFAQVSGARSPTARMWSVYADTLANQ